MPDTTPDATEDTPRMAADFHLDNIKLTTEAEECNDLLTCLTNSIEESRNAANCLGGALLGIETGRMADERGQTVEQFMTEPPFDGKQVIHPAHTELDKLDDELWQALQTVKRVSEILHGRLL